MDMKGKNVTVYISIIVLVGMLLVFNNPSFIIKADPPPDSTIPPLPTLPNSPTPPPSTSHRTYSHSTKAPHYEMEAFCEEDYCKISPDSIAKYTITIKNKGDEDTAEITYKRPSGWYGKISDREVTLGENETKDITIEIFPPASCKNGVYETYVKIESRGGEIDITLETEVFSVGDISINEFNYTVNNGDVEFHVLINNTGDKREVEVIFYVDGKEKGRQKVKIEDLKEVVFPWKLETGEHLISFECISDDENQKNNKISKKINFGEYGISKSEPEMYTESATTLMNEGKYFEAYYYYCLLNDEKGKERCEKYIIADRYEHDGKKFLENEKYTEAYSFLTEAISWYRDLGDSKKVSELEDLLKSFSDKLHPGASGTVIKTVIKNDEKTIVSLVSVVAILLLANIILVLEFSKKKSKKTEEKYRRIKEKYGL